MHCVRIDCLSSVCLAPFYMMYMYGATAVIYLRGPAAATIACASAGSFPSVMFTVPATVVPAIVEHCSCGHTQPVRTA